MGSVHVETWRALIGQTDEFHESERLPPCGDRAVLQIRTIGNPGGSGRFRASFGTHSYSGRGTGGHNGLDSVIMQFGTEEIPRLRIGIGAAPVAGSVDYVLGRFFEEERALVKSAIERSVEAITCAVDNGVVAAMNTFNKVEEP